MFERDRERERKKNENGTFIQLKNKFFAFVVPATDGNW
jgi:hypothetical protein